MPTDNEVGCLICGSSERTKCYGTFICSSCRVFFIRTSKREEAPVCKLFNNCSMSINLRMNCSGCRFQKCLQLGLKPEKVGKRGKALHAVKYFNSLHFEESKTELSLCLFPSGLRNISRLQNATTAYEYSQILFQFEMWSANFSGKSPSKYPANIDVSLKDVLMNPTLCSSREATGWDNREINTKQPYHYKNSYCRVATMVSDFLNSIPEFHKLCLQDKIKFFQQSFCLNGMISMFYLRYKTKDKSLGGSRLNRYDMTEEEKEKVRKFILDFTSSFEVFVSPKFEEIHLTDQEWILLKMLCIFHSLNNLSKEGAKVVAASNLYYSSILGKLIDEMNPYLSNEEKIYRLGKIINMTSTINLYAVKANHFYSSFIAENNANLSGSLSYDIHIREP